MSVTTGRDGTATTTEADGHGAARQRGMDTAPAWA